MIRINGPIPITIHPIFWVTAALIGYIQTETFIGSVIWIAIILVSVLVHEMGHALTAYTFGKRPRIELVALGGLTIHDRSKLSFFKQFLIVLNGPLFGFILFLGSFFILGLQAVATSPIAPFLKVFCFVNLYWTILNLLPVFPMDGGQILRIVLEGILGGKGVLISLMIGAVAGGILGLASFAFGEIFLGALFFFFGFSSFQAWKESKQLRAEDDNDELRGLLQRAEQELVQGQYEIAEEKLELVLAKTKEGLLHLTSAQMLAQIYRQKNLYEKICALLLPLKKELSPPGILLLHEALFLQQKYQEMASLDVLAYEAAPCVEVALFNSYAYGALGNTEASLGWMQTAIDAGLDNAKECLASAYFDPIRASESFQEFYQKHL